ncbi:hypothetical protein PghCCS26_00580 [Paenibacillus glycanilyticus]|uniref:Uncharacterized protein n=1 Tax=Paenibacillus glycanilyticus TaxID=126569 RepID=A0ABQ6ND79_9BACL|nr:hypothetical protein [Paenibacillus glycanilyticus]GMK42931.1 hypothetical protein PghCCS26_00580 [Paenibacillus glycanilyticus]
MIRISSLIEKGFEYHALPQGLQMLDNTLVMQLEGLEESISARLSFSFQSREWTIDQVTETETPTEWTAARLTEEIKRIFEYRPELLEAGKLLIARIDEINQMDDDEFEAVLERGEMKEFML